MRRTSRVPLIALVGCGLAVLPGAAPEQAAPDAYAREVRPILTRYCLSCHGAEKPKGNVSLASFTDEASVLKSRKVWQKVWGALHSREMPPEDKPQPTAAERDRITDWIEDLMRKPDPGGRRDPGRTVLRRLTRNEYANTLCELIPSVGRTTSPFFDPARGFPEKGLHIQFYKAPESLALPVELPPDDVEHGFDNIGEVLTLPPLLMEKYFTIASDVLEKTKGAALSIPPDPKKSRREAARDIVRRFADRAFRRPTTEAQIEPLLKVFDLADQRGDSFEASVKAALQAVLVSPDFLFKMERGEGREIVPGIAEVGNYDLASRLSYFVWSSMPDPELFQLAGEGKLRDPQVIEAQVRRMLRSPKAKALADNFALQWLQLSSFESVMPDPAIFLSFYLPGSFNLSPFLVLEPLAYFAVLVMEDRSILELVDSNWAVLNGNLAEFYGLTHFPGRVFRGGKEIREVYTWKKYDLPDRRRGGVLTMGAVLTMTSLPTRTSPVKRGKWILETILGAPPPPPPANAGNLKEAEGPAVRRPLRERLEQHRRDPNCAGCHRRMDPLGLALESYDGIGRWRDKEGPTPFQDGEETWDFNVDGDFQDWSFGFAGGEFRVRDGILSIPSPGKYVQMWSPSISKSASAVDKVTVRLKNGTASTALVLQFARPDQVKWSAYGTVQGQWQGNLKAAMEPRSDFKEYTFDLSKVPAWKDTIGMLNLAAYDTGKGELQVDWIRMSKGSGVKAPSPVDVTGALPRGEKFKGPEELKKLLVTEYKDDFTRAFVEHLMTYALGRKLEYYDFPVVKDIAQKVARDEYKISRAIVEIARSYPFLHRRTKEMKDD